MTSSKGPDWNPRTLSTFSTFGGGGHTPDPQEDDKSDESLRSTPSPIVNGKVTPSLEVSKKDFDDDCKLQKKEHLNGEISKHLHDAQDTTSPTIIDTHSERLNGHPDSIEIHNERNTKEPQNNVHVVSSVQNGSPASLKRKRPIDYKKKALKSTSSPINTKIRNQSSNPQSPDFYFIHGNTSNRSSSSSSGTSGASSMSEALIRPDHLLLPVYNHPHYKDVTNDDNLIQLRQGAKGTKVAPPIVPRHAYSKSLVGEECISFVPKHSHSRSMGEDQLGVTNGPNLKDGVREVSIFLGPQNRRFGFSVIGGIDEKFPARIDEIAKGSPADKADLEVGDEILEVNGKSLEDATHTEVISHIHQCIRSRTICLRVKRRTGNKLAADLAASSNVQDAFVIAVEQRARERLERLSALKKIKPVDMTKLSSQLSDPPEHNQSTSEEAPEDINGVLDPTPIYVTSVPNLTSTSTSTTQNQRSSSRSRSRSSTPGRTSSSSPRETPRKELSQPASGPQKKRSQPRGAEGDADPGSKSGDELELTHDLDIDNEDNVCTSRSEDDISESGDSLPATPEKNYGLGGHPPPREARREVLLDSKSQIVERPRSPLEYTTSLESKDSSSSRKSGGSGSSSGGGSAPSRPLASRGSSHYSDRNFKGDVTDSGAGDPSQEGMISMVEFDPADKEMAVDVPETFVGRTKTPPRYPPPKPHVGAGYPSSIPHNNNNNSSSSKSSSKRGTSLSSGTVTPVNGTLSKPVSPPVIPDVHQRQDVLVHSPTSQEEMRKIKRYEEEIKQRREREEEAAAEMHRNSIRGSQKLQALASYPQGQPYGAQPPPPSGVVNQAFDQEDANDDKGSSPSINELIQSLQRIQTVLKSNGHRISEDMGLVAQLLVNPEFQKVLAVHNKVQETWCLNRPPTPVTFKAQELVNECIEALNDSTSPEALELVQVLSKYPLEGLMYAHDRIADSEPPLESFGPQGDAGHSVDPAPPEEGPSRETNYPEENVQIVRIDKTNEPLGATIRNEGDSVIIGRIVQGGAAEKSGRLHEGDEILEVNGVEVRGKSVNDVCDMLAGMTGTLTFIIIPCSTVPTVTTNAPPSVHAMHFKAHFDYDPEEDLYIPCRELGMSFQKGDILHVMNQQDPNWWQAYRDGEDDQSLAGLIPSKTFQQQREAMRQTVVGDNNNKEKSKKGKLLCAKKHQKKKKKKMLYPNYNEDFDAEEILTYEEVALYFPRSNRKRPIVLIGPPNIGRHELRQKLMEDTEKVAAAVPHTSRPKKDQEVDGQDYHFISRTQFEADILARKFVEHGEFEKAYYGTSLDAIRAVVNSGKICVLNLHPLSLKMLKSSDLMPYVVLIAPPSLEKLRQKKQKLNEPFKEDDLKETIQKAREMEDQYGHYFDLVLINHDIERSYNQLVREINVLEREPQWVPASWLANER